MKKNLLKLNTVLVVSYILLLCFKIVPQLVVEVPTVFHSFLNSMELKKITNKPVYSDD